jgi:hypothetical protein
LLICISCAKKKDGEKGESFWGGDPDQRIKSVKFSKHVDRTQKNTLHSLNTVFNDDEKWFWLRSNKISREQGNPEENHVQPTTKEYNF